MSEYPNLKLGHFYWLDVADGRPGFVILDALDGFTATVTVVKQGEVYLEESEGKWRAKDGKSKLVHADCLSRQNFGRQKKA